MVLVANPLKNRERVIYNIYIVICMGSIYMGNKYIINMGIIYIDVIYCR